MNVSVGSVFVCLFRFSILSLCVSLVMLFCLLVLFDFVVLGLVSSVLRQAIGWEERLRNDLFVSSGT